MAAVAFARLGDQRHDQGALHVISEWTQSTGDNQREELEHRGEVFYVQQRQPGQFIGGRAAGGFWPQTYETAAEAKAAVESRLHLNT
jgi:hypothetical protein